MAGKITDATAVLFCDTQIRPAADKLIQLYNIAKGIQGQFTAKGLAALLPNDAAQIVQDTATTAADGRTPITGFDVNATISALNAFIAMIEANTNTVYNQVGKVAVNTR